MNEENIIVCRCEDVNLKQVKDAIKDGYHTLDEVKRVLRCGMGPCQGKNCGQLISREIAKATGKKMEEVDPSVERPPVRGIKLKTIYESVKE